MTKGIRTTKLQLTAKDFLQPTRKKKISKLGFVRVVLKSKMG